MPDKTYVDTDFIVSKNIINEYCRSTFAYTDEELEDKRTEYADFSDLSRVPLAVTSNPYADPPYLVSVYADLKHNRINRYAGYEKVGGEGLVKSQKFGSLKEMNAWMAKNLYFEDLVKTTQDEFEGYDSMDNDQLYGALYDRLKAENDMYVENLLEKSPKDIYQSSLQTITQDDIICALQDEAVELPDGEDLRLMLKTGFNLNDAYLECDYLDIYSQLADSHDILFSEAAGYARTEMENELHKEGKDARNGIAGYVQEFGKDSGTDKTKDAER